MKRKGETLIEVLIGASVLCMTIASVMTSDIMSNKAKINIQAAQRRANYVANEVEIMRANLTTGGVATACKDWQETIDGDYMVYTSASNKLTIKKYNKSEFSNNIITKECRDSNSEVWALKETTVSPLKIAVTNTTPIVLDARDRVTPLNVVVNTSDEDVVANVTVIDDKDNLVTVSPKSNQTILCIRRMSRNCYKSLSIKGEFYRITVGTLNSSFTVRRCMLK